MSGFFRGLSHFITDLLELAGVFLGVAALVFHIFAPDYPPLQGIDLATCAGVFLLFAIWVRLQRRGG
jgi:hypothetical protein